MGNIDKVGVVPLVAISIAILAIALCWEQSRSVAIGIDEKQNHDAEKNTENSSIQHFVPSSKDGNKGFAMSALPAVALSEWKMENAVVDMVPFEYSITQNVSFSSPITEEQMLSAGLLDPSPIQDYRSESLRDRDVQDLTMIYLRAVERAIAISGSGVRILGFVCGRRICLGVLTAGVDRSYADWMTSFVKMPEMSGISLQTKESNFRGKTYDLRFAFPISPDSSLAGARQTNR